MVDFIDDLDEVLERQAILAEDAMAQELREMADLLEEMDFEHEHDELLEMARYTADFNALSESGLLLKIEMNQALESY